MTVTKWQKLTDRVAVKPLTKCQPPLKLCIWDAGFQIIQKLDTIQSAFAAHSVIANFSFV